MLTVIGVMGGGEGAGAGVAEEAYRLGRLVARRGWVLLNGGRATGVMDASARGAKEAGGLTLGVLPDDDKRGASAHLDIAVVTGLGHARNYVNVLSSDVVIALPGGAGTLSEIALALKSGRHVVTIDFPLGEPFSRYVEAGLLTPVATAEEAVERVAELLG